MAAGPGGNLIKSNGVAAVDVVPSPAGTDKRLIRVVDCYNNDTIAHNVIFRVTDGTLTNIHDKQLIPAGGRYIWGTDREAVVLPTTTWKAQIVLGEAKTTNDCDCSGYWLDV